MEMKNNISKYDEKYRQIKWLCAIGIILCAVTTSILMNAITENPHAVGLSIAVAIALSSGIAIYLLRRIRIKYGVIVRDERAVNLQYRAMLTAVQIFMLCAIILCFSVWFVELFEIGKFDVALPFTEVLAYVICIILCTYIAAYFYYQRKM